MQITKYPTFITTDTLSESEPTGRIGTFYAAIGAVILNENNEVLLTQRSLTNEKDPGVWEIIFGRVNQREGFEGALKREAMEEVGIEIIPERIISTMHFMRTKQEPEHIGVIYLCRFISGQEIEPDPKEVAAWKWMNLSEAISLVADYTKPHLQWAKELLFKSNS